MEIGIASNIKLESVIHFISVECFQFIWMPNQHAELTLSGYMDSNQRYEEAEVYSSKIKIWLENEKRNKILFWGELVKMEAENIGRTTRIRLKAKSESYKLDQMAESRSFQNIKATYAEVIKKSVESAGGRTICEVGVDHEIGKPLIQYEETAWEFSRRLSSQLGTCVVPDIETGGEYFWFGMRKGNVVPAFSEKEYEFNICRVGNSKKKEAYYNVESREFYKIGDSTRFCNQDVVICGVFALFKNGELIFRYTLKRNASFEIIYHNKFLGLGLKGTIMSTRQEQVKIAFDIDGGVSTGEYFYDWYPETGNALYAVPEKGTRVVLYFGCQDEREGFALYSLLDAAYYEESYINRRFDTKEGNLAHLSAGRIVFSNKQGHRTLLEDDSISICSTGKMTILAHSSINFSASQILISTPDELNICQG